MKLEGLRTPSGRVLVPPAEHDPDTGAAIADDWVEVGPAGVVVSWTPGWALIRLDGADTALLHRVDGEVTTGARVTPRWRAERVGAITDIECFVPCHA
jgi:uncharacterized OB-fold protein